MKTSIEQFDYLLLDLMLSPTVLYLPVIVIVIILNFSSMTTSMVDSVGTERLRRLAGFDDDADSALILFFVFF